MLRLTPVLLFCFVSSFAFGADTPKVPEPKPADIKKDDAKPTKTREQIVKEFEDKIRDLDVTDPKYDEAVKEYESALKELKDKEPKPPVEGGRGGFPMQGRIQIGGGGRVVIGGLGAIGGVPGFNRMSVSTSGDRFAIRMGSEKADISVTGDRTADGPVVKEIVLRQGDKDPIKATKVEELPEEFRAPVQQVIKGIR